MEAMVTNVSILEVQIVIECFLKGKEWCISSTFSVTQPQAALPLFYLQFVPTVVALRDLRLFEATQEWGTKGSLTVCRLILPSQPDRANS